MATTYKPASRIVEKSIDEHNDFPTDDRAQARLPAADGERMHLMQDTCRDPLRVLDETTGFLRRWL